MQELKNKTQWILIGEDLPEAVEAWRFVQDPACGAVNLFTGITRNHHDGRKVKNLYYDVYSEMAIREAEKLVASVMEQFAISRIALFHRTGDAPVGQVTLVAALSAPHRRPVLRATGELITRLKQEIPVWKKESFEDSDLWKEEQLIGNRRE